MIEIILTRIHNSDDESVCNIDKDVGITINSDFKSSFQEYLNLLLNDYSYEKKKLKGMLMFFMLNIC